MNDRERLEAIIAVVCKYLPPDGIPIKDAMSEIISLVDPLPPLPEQPVQEPVTWDKPSASFNAWWDSDRRRDNANPFATDSFAYWAWEGWQAAQRPWVELTEQDMPSGEDPMFDHKYFIAGMVYADKVLKERNT